MNKGTPAIAFPEFSDLHGKLLVAEKGVLLATTS
jgi:hypothetical protein